MIKWVVVDMDGTLLNDEDKISERTKRCLIKCQELNIRIILASGRSYTRLMPYARELNMSSFEGRLIEVNGMSVYELKTGSRRIIRRLYREEIEKLFTFCQKLQTEVQCFQDDAVYYWIPKWQEEKKREERIRRNLPDEYPDLGGAWSWITDARDGYPLQVKVENVGQVPETVNKVNCCSDSESNQRNFLALKNRFSNEFEIVRSCPRLIEISPGGITKGAALRMLMEEESVSPDEVIVFGDGENDVDMFRSVTYSYAMENAEEFIKKQARMVTAANTQDGIAVVLEELIKGMQV